MFQTPNEVTQRQLRQLRVSMVEALNDAATLFPAFDTMGRSRAIFVDTARNPSKTSGEWEPGSLFVIDEFPMEIRVGKAIYARPMASVHDAREFAAERLAGLWVHDPWERLARHPQLPSATVEFFARRNAFLLEHVGDRIADVCYSRDLRKVTGATARRSFFNRRRLEPIELARFLERAVVVERAEPPSRPSPEPDGEPASQPSPEQSTTSASG